ncbi:RNA polymerase sigma-70 factor [Pedobacter hiemivivus]|uniref:RNA polymerase sigma-70 factor n=1 Tax=Pedobacter hiemivivus TaxID=2530454 RepID=A0A4U1FYN0_9SPHI|nr:RNA polymerase sigma-70 factor [Pedobacter hiemivivus]TKC54983.1 RNA polymerase sigma-70 factor [Pedobacter hiemivivus]
MNDYILYSDQELAVLLKGGQELAFVELYNRYKDRIFGNLVKLLKSQDLALEISQDLFLKIWDIRTELDPEKSFRSYLFRIAENMVMDVFRKAARDKKLQAQLMTLNTELYSHIEEHMIEMQENKLFIEAIAKLPPQRRKVFTLCKLEGKSYKEVAELLGISTYTVSDHLTKANRFLKDQLNPASGLALAIFAMAIVDGI